VGAAVERDQLGRAEWLSLKEILIERCGEVGRDPAEITCSVNVRIDPDAELAVVVDQITPYAEAGAEPGRAEPAAERRTDDPGPAGRAGHALT